MTRPSGLYAGGLTDADTHERSGESLGLDPADLTTHGVIVGMTGSGKTGLGIVLLEEALAQGIPTLVLDPKGDMGNLLLTFPDLAPSDFEPWVPTGGDPETVAQTWADGLADWGVDRAEIGALRSGHPMTVYTPGSTAGVPLDVIGSLVPPSGAVDAEALRDEVESLVQGLLGLVGVTSDPMSGREHVLMANLVESAWVAGETLDLGTLLLRIQDPPMRRLGVIELDTFFPRPDRVALSLRLNGLLASPSFAAWGSGVPLDIPRMLWGPDGQAQAAVVYLAHLSDEERQMVVTRVLSKLVTWMRTQSGSTDLRVLVYMDEVFGFVPPTAAPPSKKPILTLFKQARAFGVGVVLSTQNPVDLDYKAISNAGTWMIGRLQTERDKQRLMEGLNAASGGVDTARIDATISALAKREFLLHSTSGQPPRTFGVRWAMSYLTGPLSKDQLRRLPGQPATAEPGAGPAAGEASPGATVPPSTDAPASSPSAGGVTPATSGGPLADDETMAMPEVAAGIDVRYLDPAAPWATTVGASPGGRRLHAAVALRCSLLYDDTKLDLRHTEEWEAVLFPLSGTPDPAAATIVDYDDRDLVPDAPAGSVYVVPDAPIGTAKWFTTVTSGVKDHLVHGRTLSVSVNRRLKLASRPGEAADDFAARCRAAADGAADAEADTLRARLATRIDRVRDQIAEAEQRAQHLREEAAASRTGDLLSGAGSVLGALFGGRRSARSITTAAGRVASGTARASRAGNRVDQAVARVESKVGDLQELEDQLADELADIVAEWDEAAASVETVEVPLEKSDVAITGVSLVWIPTA